MLPGRPCPALPAAQPCSLPFPAAAQLDSIGFSIIKKCIHAVETRGRAGLALGQLLPVEQFLSCPFHGQDDS